MQEEVAHLACPVLVPAQLSEKLPLHKRRQAAVRYLSRYHKRLVITVASKRAWGEQWTASENNSILPIF